MKILVIGDACLDIFRYCRCSRLCPEAPVPVLDVIHEKQSLGMAGNVWRNIVDLSNHDVKAVFNPNCKEVTKTRYVDIKTNHMFIRVDSSQKINKAANYGDSPLETYDAVVISDYNKGFLTEESISYIAQNSKLTFLDTKRKISNWANDITFIKINREEFRLSEPFLTTRLRSKIIETLGEDGCSYNNKIYPVQKVEVKDLSGAGDSFLAALVVKYLETNSIEKALYYANEVATIVVQKMGVSTIKS